MEPNLTALERAFELARSGKFSTLQPLIHAMRKEGYSDYQLYGPLLRQQLRELMGASSASKPKFK
jgi:hypothetical protein